MRRKGVGMAAVKARMRRKEGLEQAGQELLAVRAEVGLSPTLTRPSAKSVPWLCSYARPAPQRPRVLAIIASTPFSLLPARAQEHGAVQDGLARVCRKA